MCRALSGFWFCPNCGLKAASSTVKEDDFIVEGGDYLADSGEYETSHHGMQYQCQSCNTIFYKLPELEAQDSGVPEAAIGCPMCFTTTGEFQEALDIIEYDKGKPADELLDDYPVKKYVCSTCRVEIIIPTKSLGEQ